MHIDTFFKNDSVESHRFEMRLLNIKESTTKLDRNNSFTWRDSHTLTTVHKMHAVILSDLLRRLQKDRSRLFAFERTDHKEQIRSWHCASRGARGIATPSSSVTRSALSAAASGVLLAFKDTIE